jgi:hypothetical protein
VSVCYGAPVAAPPSLYQPAPPTVPSMSVGHCPDATIIIMALGAFVLGVVVGVVVAAALAAAAAYAFLQATAAPAAGGRAGPTSVSSSSSLPAAPPSAAASDWPPGAVRLLRGMLAEATAAAAAGAPPESARWLNALLVRFWLELRVSGLYRERMTRKLVSKLRRKLDTSFVVRRTPPHALTHDHAQGEAE